jgi:23S rRNA pseudouridine2457 synthase
LLKQKGFLILCREIYFPVLTNPSIYKVSLLRDFCFMHHYYLFYKPFQVLCTFTSTEGKSCLANYIQVAKDVYPVGRLDYDSEGLLLLTNDPSLNHRLLDPGFRHQRTYCVQVEGTITQEALKQLERGVSIRVDGKEYATLPAHANRLSETPALPERNPPIRFRKNLPTSWISITLTEGKNRQVRKMTAAVGFPTLRLVRFSIGQVELANLLPGQLVEVSRNTLLQKLFSR